METQIDWKSRWVEGRIGFHQEQADSLLVEHWAVSVPDSAATVLVPLCGKSLDMLWLHQRGHKVIGVELSDIAIRAFFEENELDFEVSTSGVHQVFTGTGVAAGLQLWCGDFFKLTQAQLGGVDALYDRAAIVALPPALRRSYVSQLDTLLSSAACGLMLTFDYPQAERGGPPFSVSFSDVVAQLGESFDCTLVDTLDLTEDNRWSLSRLEEPVIRLKRR